MGILKSIARLLGGPGGATLEAGAAAPPFTLRSADGRTFSLEEGLKEGPLLLAFFKVSCPTCQFTFPFLERLHRATQQDGRVRLWGVSQNDAKDTQEFARDLGLSFPLLLDEEGYSVSNDYGLTNVPTLFLVDPGPTIRSSSVGFSRRELEAIAEAFRQPSAEPITLFLPGERIPDSKAG